jgi:hypothetical protein
LVSASRNAHYESTLKHVRDDTRELSDAIDVSNDPFAHAYADR